MMSYQQALDYIQGSLVFGSRPGLTRMTALLEALGNPQNEVPVVHVAGTNGKGSTTTMIASVLQEAGYCTGCYTSPYVFDFRERFQINGQMIPKETLAALTAKVKTVADRLQCEGMEPPTEFEIVTAIGFLFFQESHCDAVVLEVGMGGRFDATNVIASPLAAVLCSISMDHMEYLGATLEKIAFEKCGIIKPGRPAILYCQNPPAVLSVVREQCRLKNAPLRMGDIGALQILTCNASGSNFLYKGLPFTLSLRGEHQIYNAVTAIETLLLLRQHSAVHFSDQALQSGIQKAYIHARLDPLWAHPLVMADGGHNKEGIDSLVHALNTMEELRDPVIVFGMLRDKPYQYAIRQLALRARAFICVTPESPRAMSAYDLKNIAALYCEKSYYAENYEDAARLALKIAQNGPLLIAGSLYLIGPMTAALKKIF